MGLREYIEISKLGIVIVLDIVALATMLLASKWQISIDKVIYLLIAGSLASMGSGAINHYYDRDIDSLMSRTSKRPLPSGRIKPRNALIYGTILSVTSIVLAYFTLNTLTAFFIALGIVFYIFVYTIYLKRRNASNIVIGGFAGSCAAYAGWSTATGSIDILGILVGLIIFLWTPSHFWALAIRIKEEYTNAKIPMLPVLIGEERTARYIFLNNLILVPYTLIITLFGLGIVYLIAAVVGGSIMLLYSIRLVKNTNKALALKAYLVSNQYLLIICLGLMLDPLVSHQMQTGLNLLFNRA